MSKKDKSYSQNQVKISSGVISFSDLTSSSSSFSSSLNLNTSKLNKKSTKSTPSTSILASINPNYSGKLNPIYNGTHSELLIHTKKFFKKDMMTKLKSLNDAQNILIELLKDIDTNIIYIDEFLSFFIYSIPKFLFDDNWQIREKIISYFIILFDNDKIKNLLETYFIDIISYIFFLLSDNVKTISQKSLNLLNKLFLPKKKLNILTKYSYNILKFLLIILKLDKKLLIEYTHCSEEEAHEKLERLTINSIDSLSLFISTLTNEQNLLILDGVKNINTNNYNDIDDIISYKSFFENNLLLNYPNNNNIDNNINLKFNISLNNLLYNISEHFPILLKELNEELILFLFNCLSLDALNLNSLALKTIISIENSYQKLDDSNYSLWKKPINLLNLLTKLNELKKKSIEIISDNLLNLLLIIPVDFISIYSKNNEEPKKINEKILNIFKLFLNELYLLFSVNNYYYNLCITNSYYKLKLFDNLLGSILESLIFILLRSNTDIEYIKDDKKINFYLNLFVNFLIFYDLRSYYQESLMSASLQNIEKKSRGTNLNVKNDALDSFNLLNDIVVKVLNLINQTHINNKLYESGELMKNNLWILLKDNIMKNFSLIYNNNKTDDIKIISTSYLLQQIINFSKKDIVDSNNFSGFNYLIESFTQYFVDLYLNQLNNEDDFNNLFVNLSFINSNLLLLSENKLFSTNFFPFFNNFLILENENRSSWFLLLIKNFDNIKNKNSLSFSSFNGFLQLFILDKENLNKNFNLLINNLYNNNSIALVNFTLQFFINTSITINDEVTSLNQIVQFDDEIVENFSSILNQLLLTNEDEVINDDSYINKLLSLDSINSLDFIIGLVYFNQFSSIVSQQLNECITLWMSHQNNQITLWLFLSLLYNLLKEQESNFTSLSSKLEDCLLVIDLDSWMSPEDDYDLLSRLQHLFFSRDLENKQNLIEKTEFEKKWQKSLSFTSFNTWNDIEHKLFSFLSPTFHNNFTNKIINILNKRLLSSSSYLHSSPSSPMPSSSSSNNYDIEEETEEETFDFLSISPKKWMKHWLHLNKIKSDFKIETDSIVNLFDINFWFQLIESLTTDSSITLESSNWEYILLCMTSFLEFSFTEEIDGEISSKKNSNLLFSSIHLFLTFFTCLHNIIFTNSPQLTDKIKTMAKNLEDYCFLEFNNLSSLEQQDILNKLINYYNHSLITEEKSNNKFLLSSYYLLFYKKFISILYFKKPSSSDETTQNYFKLKADKTFTISSPNPPLFNVKNQSAFYLTTEDSEENNEKKINLLPCEIVSCHTDDGIQFPYYSIQFTDQSGNKKEKQVDWSRILIKTSSNSSNLLDYHGNEIELLDNSYKLNEINQFLAEFNFNNVNNVDYFLHFLVKLIKNIVINFYLLNKKSIKNNNEIDQEISKNNYVLNKHLIIQNINNDLLLLDQIFSLFLNNLNEYLSTIESEELKNKYIYYFNSFIISPLKFILISYYDEKIIGFSTIEDNDEISENLSTQTYESSNLDLTNEDKLFSIINIKNNNNFTESSEFLGNDATYSTKIILFNNLNKLLKIVLSNVTKINEIDSINNNFLWCPLLFSQLFSISFHYSIEKKDKDEKFLINLMNSYNILLTYLNYSSIFTLLSTHILPFFVKEFNSYFYENSSEISTYRISFIKLMNSFWSWQSNDRAALAAASSANDSLGSVVTEEKLNSWEIDAFSHLIDTFVIILQSYFPIVDGEVSFVSSSIVSPYNYSLLFSCFSAITSSMKLKSRNYMIKLVKNSNIKNYKNILIDYFLIKNKLYLNSIILPFNVIYSSVNLILTKLLDIYFSCGEDWDNEEIKLIVKESLKEVEENVEENAKNEEKIEKSDKEELNFDRKIFKTIYGEKLFSSLLNYFDPEVVLNRVLLEDFSVISIEDVNDSIEESEDELEKHDENEDEIEENIANLISVLMVKQKSNPKIKHNLLKYNKNYKKNTILHNILNNSPLNSINLWIITLQILDSVSLKYSSLRTHCTSFLKDSGIFEYVISLLFLLIKNKKDQNVSTILQFSSIYVENFNFNQNLSLNSSLLDMHNAFNNNFNILSSPFLPNPSNSSFFSPSNPFVTLEDLATYALFRTICILPSMMRNYWNNNCNRNEKNVLSKFIEDKVRNSLLKREISLISISKLNNNWSEDQFKVKGNLILGEIQASLIQDEVEIVITIALPKNYPLKNVEVQCSSKLGIKDNNWRRWVLQMIQLLSQHDKSVIDAILLWKLNITKEMEGIEPCPICYCTIHAKSMKLPSLSCPTCKNKFHPICVSTWFKTSGKNKCVLCQQPMLSR